MQSVSEQPRQTHLAIDTDLAENRPSDNRFVASFAQERLWFLHHLPFAASAYHVPAALRMEGDLDVETLQDTFAELIRRHESLRTHFEEAEEGTVQVIEPASVFRLACTDLSELEGAAQEAQLDSEMKREAQAPFSLSRGPLIRVRLWKLSGHLHVLLVTMHHIVSDAWSAGVLVRELSVLYTAFRRGEPSPLHELEVQYADYSSWQRERLSGEVLEGQLCYWRSQLADAPGALELPADRPRPTTASYAGATVPFSLSASLAGRLGLLCRSERVTPFMLLMSAFHVLLSRWSGQKDIIVGAPVAGRTQLQTESLIGFFVNMLPIRSRIADDATFRALLWTMRETALDAYSHQDIPFEKLVAELRPERDLSRQPICQVTFALHNQPQEQLELPGLKLTPISWEGTSSKFDLSLYAKETREGIQCFFEYATDLFDRATIERLVGHFEVLLEGIVEDPDRQIWQLSLMKPAERERVVVEWNRTARESGRQLCIHELFCEQAARTPDAVALVCEERQTTYAELDRRSNQLARHLMSLGVGPDVIVAVCLERSVELVVGLLGILKAGGAYLPLDPNYPGERLAHMLADAAPGVLLTQERFRSAMPAASTVVIDADWSATAGRQSEAPCLRASSLDSRSLAYVIYTSGSTGKPKGVMVTHASVVSFLRSMQRSPGIDSTDRLLAVTTISFDIAALEIYLPLLVGATLVLATREMASDARQLMAALDEQCITLMQATPATWQLLLNGGWNSRSSLKALCGGEALTADLARELVGRVGSLWNLYGPTETTIWSSCRLIEAPQGRTPVEPVGPPIDNTQVYVLDSYLQPVSTGAAGEIFIGGLGVARGYLNRPALTAERFVSSPFGCGERLYRTGDRARFLANGTLQFLGRMDGQVKIRGYRIEPGEIEETLLRHTAVGQAAVVAREDESGGKRLVAYVVAAPDRVLPPTEDLQLHMKRTLPDYMIPAVVVMLEALPLTPSGKLDRGALPAPEARLDLYAAPRTRAETLLAEIWADVLNVERVGIYDNFFELGGHSLLTMKIVARIYDVFQINLPVWTVFQLPSIASLATLLADPDTPEADPGSAKDGSRAEFEHGIL